MATLNEIRNLISLVAQSRVAAMAAKNAYNLALAEWETTNIELIDLATETKDAQQESEMQLRQTVVEYFRDTGDKTLTPGVAIRMTKQVEYQDAPALEWAKKHVMALQLDRKAFERLAIGGHIPVEIATIIEMPTATIATDLSKIEKE